MGEEDINYHITVRAGTESETPGEPFRYISSGVPDGVKSVDEKPYSDFARMALEAAKSAVLRTNKNLTLTLDVTVETEK